MEEQRGTVKRGITKELTRGLEKALALEIVRVTEAAAVSASRWMGHGDRHAADQAATEAMRQTLDTIDISGTIVIGEGERDEAPMLYIGEKVGKHHDNSQEIDIAVDPLEGTNLTACGLPNSTAVIAVSERGGLLHAPDTYLDKLVVPPKAVGKVDINAPVADNLAALAKALGRDVADLVVVLLDRPRHAELISEVRRAGARIQLLSDGDLTPAIAAAIHGYGVHCVMGTGGAPEGVLTAAALRCLGGEIQGKFKPRHEEEAKRARKMGIDLDKVYFTEDLAPGKGIIFAATGITDGTLLKGVRFFGGGFRTHSLVMTSQRVIRFIDSIQASDAVQTIELH